MESANIDGVVLEYEKSGTGEPVVFIHGALIADAFLPLVHATDLAQAFQLIVYHRRGYAGSSHLDAPVTLPQQAADCLALLHYLGIERAHVAGHSLGGSIALQLALDAPETVGTLALMEPAMFVGETADSYRESLRQGAERVSQAGATAAVDGFLSARWTGFRAPLDRLVPGGFEQAVRDAGDQFTHEMPGLLDWQFGDDDARRVTQPTLSILGGANDLPGTRFQDAHRYLQAALPNVEGMVIPGLEHMLHVQEPGKVAAILADFWDRHPLTAQ